MTYRNKSKPKKQNKTDVIYHKEKFVIIYTFLLRQILLYFFYPFCFIFIYLFKVYILLYVFTIILIKKRKVIKTSRFILFALFLFTQISFFDRFICQKLFAFTRKSNVSCFKNIPVIGGL